MNHFAHHAHISSHEPTEVYERPSREVSAATQKYSDLVIEDIFKRLGGVDLLDADFVRKAVRDCGEYLNFSSMASPHLKSGEQGCVAVFGSSRSMEFDYKGLVQVEDILSLLVEQEAEGGARIAVHGVRPKKIVSILKQLKEINYRPQNLAVEKLESLSEILTEISALNDPKLLELINQTPESLANLTQRITLAQNSGKSPSNKLFDLKALLQIETIFKGICDEDNYKIHLTNLKIDLAELHILQKDISKCLAKPGKLSIPLTEEIEDILTKIYNDRNPQLRRIVRQTPESISQLRTKLNMHWGYQKSMQMGASLDEAGFMVMSGGGPGSMEGSCRGANPNQKLDANVIAVAINIPGEPGNPYIPGHGPGHHELVKGDSSLDRRSEHDKFTMRKWGLVHESNGLIVMPGGFGTMEEFLEVLSLISGGNIDQPVCFVGKRFWSPIIRALKETGFITKDLASRISIVDDTKQAADKIKDYYVRNHSVDGKIVWPKRWQNLDDDLDRDFLVKRKVLPDGSTAELFSFPQHEFEKLAPERREVISELLAIAKDEMAKVLGSCPHADLMTPKMITGFAKFLVDSLNIGSKMAELKVDHPVLLMGSQNQTHFTEMKSILLQNGVSVVQKIGDTETGGIGITVSVPNINADSDNVSFDIDIPARIRAMALDIAAGQCNKIFVANGGIKALHRTFQYLCWIQTGKLKDTQLVVIDPHKRFMKAFKAICEQSENFGCTKRSERGFIQIFQSREEAVAAGHIELAA